MSDNDAAECAALHRRFEFLDAAACRRLEAYAALLRQWQKAHNLVAAGTLAALWSRHIADCLQLVPPAPPFRHWVDLGSGAGLPGLVVAIALADRPQCRFTLVEANQKKCAFLRAAVRDTGAHAAVAAARIESHGRILAGAADIVSARALAPLPELCALAHPYLHAGSVVLLLKGRDFAAEEHDASRAWRYDLETMPSATDPGGRIVALRNLTPRT